MRKTGETSGNSRYWMEERCYSINLCLHLHLHLCLCLHLHLHLHSNTRNRKLFHSEKMEGEDCLIPNPSMFAITRTVYVALEQVYEEDYIHRSRAMYPLLRYHIHLRESPKARK